MRVEMSDSEGVIDKRKNKCGLFYLAGAGYDERSETVGSLAGSGSKLVLVTMTSLNIASAGAIMKSDDLDPTRKNICACRNLTETIAFPM
jgi:hypothetical protein